MSRKAFIWHSLCESRRLSVSENECLAENRRTDPELHVLYNVLGFVVIHIQNTLFETSLKKLTFKRGFKKCR